MFAHGTSRLNDTWPSIELHAHLLLGPLEILFDLFFGLLVGLLNDAEEVIIVAELIVRPVVRHAGLKL